MNRFFQACVLLAALAVATAASAQTAFFVRHAERADANSKTKETDPVLSPEGRSRAEALAALLRDASIGAIFTTEYQRTKQTAEPLAKALGIDITVVPSKDAAALVERIKAAKGNVLVVGHSNTVPEAMKRLGVKEQVEIAETEFDRLFVVVHANPPALVQLRYK